MSGAQLIMRRANRWIQWARMFFLYREAFPSTERKPFRVIAAMQKKGKSDVWYFKTGGRFAGFASTVNGRGLVMIDYLAVSRKLRGQGLGSAMLEALKERYADTGVFVEIESVYEEADNTAERIRRKKFYLSHDMTQMNVMADVFGVRMELLGWNCWVDFEEYRALYGEYNPMTLSHITFVQHPEAKEKDIQEEGACEA